MSENFARHKIRPGWLEVIVGCMYSGKTEELIKQLQRAEYGKQRIQVFKPKIDTRYSKDQVASHSNSRFPSAVVESSRDIFPLLQRHTDVVGIDEAQFFDAQLPEVCEDLAIAGKRVIVAGLDTDWKGQPFGCMPQLLALAEVIRKQYAICVVCGEPATRTQRMIAVDSDILVGSVGSYEARCRMHFDPDLCRRLSDTAEAGSKATTPS